MDIGISYGGAALAGILSFFSPCVLPLVPFYLCYLAGISMEEIATMTGHTDKKTTETYVHLTPNYQKNMVKVIEDKMRRGKNGANRFLSIDKEKKETKNKVL